MTSQFSLSDSWRGEPRRRIYQHERPVIPTPAGRWGERLNAPTVLLLEHVGCAVSRVVPELALLFGFDDALIQREALSARRIDYGERSVAGPRGSDLRATGRRAVQDDTLIGHELCEGKRFEQTANITHLESAGVIEGFVPGNIGPDNATWPAKEIATSRGVPRPAGSRFIHLPDIVIAVGVTACSGQHRPVGRLPRVVIIKPLDPAR